MDHKLHFVGYVQKSIKWKCVLLYNNTNNSSSTKVQILRAGQELCAAKGNKKKQQVGRITILQLSAARCLLSALSFYCMSETC